MLTINKMPKECDFYDLWFYYFTWYMAKKSDL